jgi:hypothetical protein
MPWDLSSSSHFPLHERQDHYRTIELKDMVGNTAKKLYFIYATKATKGIDWLLAVDSPVTAIQCLRSCRDITEAVRYLMGQGIPFNTLNPCHTFSPPLTGPPPPPISLGVRPIGYQPDAADYAAYEAARDHFLRSSRARAAILKGGIVWRLAMEFIGPGCVLTGPSDVASSEGQIFHFTDDTIFCEDILNDDELDLICGVYRVYTGRYLSGFSGSCINSM